MRVALFKDAVAMWAYAVAFVAEVLLLGPVSVWLVLVAVVVTSWLFDHYHAKTLGLSRRTVMDRLAGR